MATASPLARARRSTELSLVVMAGMFTAGAYTLVSLGQYSAVAGAHHPVPRHAARDAVARPPRRALVRARRRPDDPPARRAAARHRLRDDHPASTRTRPALQTTWSILAIATFVVVLAVVQRAADLARFRWTFLALGVALLVMPLMPGVGRSYGGARIWVSLGPVNFQPGEFAKICLAIFFAAYLADNRQLIAGATWKLGPFHLPEPRFLLPVAAAWGFAVLVMVAEEDLGSSLLFFTLFVVMLWVSTERTALPRDRRPALRARGVRVVEAVRPRAAPCRHLARPVDAGAAQRQRLPDRAGDLRARRRRADGHRPRSRQPRGGAARVRATSSSPRSARNSGCSAAHAC